MTAQVFQRAFGKGAAAGLAFKITQQRSGFAKPESFGATDEPMQDCRQRSVTFAHVDKLLFQHVGQCEYPAIGQTNAQCCEAVRLDRIKHRLRVSSCIDFFWMTVLSLYRRGEHMAPSLYC
jgi:hypothetical protein